MARYIAIDNNSGFIWGDNADLNGKIFNGSPFQFVTALDRSLGEYERIYDLHRRPIGSGYRIYRADVKGSEAVPVITDGQDQEMIDAVENYCEYVGFISFSNKSDSRDVA